MEKNEYAIMYSMENEYWWYRGLHALVEKYIRLHAHTARHSLAILDAGCGTGRMMELAAPYGVVEGFDFSQEAIDFCAKRRLTSVFRLDLNEWSSAEQRYDIITNLDVLYHKAINDPQDVLAGFNSALKPGGILIMNNPAFELLRRNHDAAVHTRQRYVKRTLVEMLKKAGFRVQVVSYRLPHLFIIMLLKRVLERIFPSKELTSDLSALPQWLNSLLFFFNTIENAMIFRGIPMPFGSSVFIVARK